MNGTGNTWIERMHGTQNLKRSFGISNRIANKRCLVGAELITCVTWAGVPGRRYDTLVVFDLSILDDNPMGEQTAWCFMDPDAASVRLWGIQVD